jgi:acyl-CoA oxidase
MQQPSHTRRLNQLYQHLNPTTTTTTTINHEQVSAHNRKPSSSADYLHLFELITPEQNEIRLRVQEFMNKYIVPTIADTNERAEPPLNSTNLKELSKITIGGTFCEPAHQDYITTAMIIIEMAKVDASVATTWMVHSGISMVAIGLCGSQEQKNKYLPAMSRYETLGSFALTEPELGSDASNMKTIAVYDKQRNGYILNGKKRWIGNAYQAGVNVIWARVQNSDSSAGVEIGGFIVEKNTPGMKIKVIQNKISMRGVQNCDIDFDNCFVPESQRLENATNFKNGPGKVLFVSRLFAAWLPVGLSMGVYEKVHAYCCQRSQFNSTLSGFQLVQEKLVKILTNIQVMFLLGLRGCQLLSQNKLTHGMSSMMKAHNTKLGRECVALARELLGGNGIVRDYAVATAFCDMEAVYTYEGSYDTNILICGQEITGKGSFYAPTKRNN